jgi:hypothetical protein
MVHRVIPRLAALALAAALLAPAAADAQQGLPRGTVKLRPAPGGVHSVPGGRVVVSPTAIPGGDPTQRIEFKLTLRQTVRSGRFGVLLPGRWLQPRGRTPYVRSADIDRGKLVRSGARREVVLRRVRAGETVTISLRGLNPPAGTYTLGLLWDGMVVDRARVIVRGRTTLPAAHSRSSAAGSTRISQTFQFGSDPGVVFDQTGTGWYSFIAFDDSGSGGDPNNRVVVNRLPAGGSSFQAQNTGLPNTGNQTFQDKSLIDADTVPTSPHFGRLYAVWTDNEGTGEQKIVISFCDTRISGVNDSARCDDPANWTGPTPVTDSTGSGSFIYADVAAAPDGGVYVVWLDYASNEIQGDHCVASSNCATPAGWGSDQTLRPLNATGGPIPFDCPTPYAAGGRVAPVPSVDVTESGTEAGRVHLALSDIRADSVPFVTKCTGAETDMHWDVFYGSSSTGLPTSFTSASGDPGNRDHFLPWMDVDQTSGDVAIAFYRSSIDTDRSKARFVHKGATAAGALTGAITELSTADSDYSASGEPLGYSFDYGDYEGVAADGGSVYPVWTDGRLTFPCCEVLFRKFTPSGPTLGTETNLTGDGSPANEDNTQGAETMVDTTGAGSTKRVLAGANDMNGPGMLAFLSTNDGASFSVLPVPLTTNVGGAPSGGGGGTTTPPPAARDTRAAVLRLRIPRQRVLRRRALLILFRPDEDVRATFRASLSIPGASRSFRLRAVTKNFKANRRVTVRIRVSRNVLRKLRRALRRHRRVIATVRVTAVDGAGNRSSKRKRFRVRR